MVTYKAENRTIAPAPTIKPRTEKTIVRIANGLMIFGVTLPLFFAAFLKAKETIAPTKDKAHTTINTIRIMVRV